MNRSEGKKAHGTKNYTARGDGVPNMAPTFYNRWRQQPIRLFCALCSSGSIYRPMKYYCGYCASAPGAVGRPATEALQMAARDRTETADDAYRPQARSKWLHETKVHPNFQKYFCLNLPRCYMTQRPAAKHSSKSNARFASRTTKRTNDFIFITNDVM